MKKFLTSLVLLSALTISTTFGAITLRYQNNDSKTYKFKVKMDGWEKEVEFGSSRTTSVTIQGSGEQAVIITPYGEVKVKQGDKIEIRDGHIKVL